MADVKALTEAVAIFKGQYFERPKINQLPAPLQASVYDMQVNAGANAIKILQRLTAEFGVKLAVDGVLSPKSIGAIDRIHRKAGRAVCRCLRYRAAQLLFPNWRPAAGLTEILRDPKGW